MATRISPPQNKTYYINPAYLTFVENSGYGANLIQVSASSSCYISVYDPANGIGYSDADRNYKRWKVTAYNNRFPNNSMFHIYARLEREGGSALVVYDTVLRGVNGGEITTSTDENGNEVKVEGEPNADCFFIKIGEVGETDGTSIREITYDTGYLTSDEALNDKTGMDEMWELDKYGTPWLIRAKHWLQSFTVKGLVTLIGGLMFKSGEVEKTIVDVKRSIDSDEEFLLDENGDAYIDEAGNPVKNPNYVPINDTTIPTTLYIERMNDDRFLRKDRDDSTPYSLGVGGSLILKSKPITELTRFYDEEKPEHATDVAVYSALMTEKAIEASLEGLNEKFLRKDIEDTAHKHIAFEEGITVYDLAKMMNLEVEQLATIARAIIKAGAGMEESISSEKFVDGFFGEGFRIWHNIATGDWNMTLDRLTVRKVMMIFELVIQKIRSVGGMIVVSAANGKVKEVVKEGLEYKFTFEDTNMFVEHDLMRCQTFSKNYLKYYWVEVTRVVGENVYARIADFEGVEPEAGDECVLMGNTKNVLRQNLLLLSATEDGQPRFDCYDGIKTKNFEDCLKVRVGALDGIIDPFFPADNQPHGYGLYGNNCYLTGTFVLSTGVDVKTQFTIMEGQIRSEISSVRSEINAKDNYLSNASFTSNLDKWEYENDVRVFDTSGGLLYFNSEFYSDKRVFAGVIVKDNKNVLRIKNSFICQKNEDYSIRPAFDLYENEETGESLYRPRMFYVAFKYMVQSAGTLRVYFRNEYNDGTWEEYKSIDVEENIGVTNAFSIYETEGKWNGTGDIYISFDGDIFIYDLALADNALADVEEKFTSRFEQTDKKIQANFDHTVGKLEEYHSEFLLTAESLESTFNSKLTNQYTKITNEYNSKITQTAESLESDYEQLVRDAKGEITEAYNSKISQTAKEIRADLSSYVETLEGQIEDTNASISATAERLESDYSKQITDLKNGEIKTMQSTLTQQANLIATKVSETTFNKLEGRVTTAESSIIQTANDIRLEVSNLQTDLEGQIKENKTAINLNATDINLRATKSEVNSLGERVTTAEAAINLNADNIELKVSKNGVISSINQSPESVTINASKINLVGAVSFNSFNSSLQSTINGKVSSSSLGSLAYENAVSSAMLDSTIISGGYIKTSLIDVDALVAKKVVTSSDSNGVAITMQDGYMSMKKGDTTLVGISSGGGTSGGIALYTSTAAGSTMALSPNGFYHYSTGGGVVLEDGVLKFLTGAKLKNLRLTTMSSSLGDGNFFVANGSFSFPTASTESGKIIWVYAKSNTTVSGFYDADGSYLSSSKTMKGMNFFISDGSYWYRGYCQ